MRVLLLSSFAAIALFSHSPEAAAEGLDDEIVIAEGEVDSPAVARSGRNGYVAWRDVRSPWGSGEVMFCRDAGTGFEPAIQLSDSDGSASGPVILADRDDVFVAWRQRPADDSSVALRVSRDGGKTFGPILEVSAGAPGGTPILASSGSRLYVAWSFVDDDEVGGILLRTSDDKGRTFGPLLRADSHREYGGLSISAHGSGVHLLWDDSGRNDDPSALLRSSLNHGRSLGSVRTLSSHQRDLFASYVGDVAAHGNHVIATWSHCERNFGEFASHCALVLRRSVDKGATFHPETPVVEASNLSFSSVLGGSGMAASKRNVSVAWAQKPEVFENPSDVFLRQSQDGGATFGPTIDVSESPATASELARLAADGDVTHVLWIESTPWPPFNRTLMGRTVVGGTPGPLGVLGEDVGNERDVRITADKGQFDVVWTSPSPMGTRVHYRHGSGGMW